MLGFGLDHDRKVYGKTSKVIHPPVCIELCHQAAAVSAMHKPAGMAPCLCPLQLIKCIVSEHAPNGDQHLKEGVLLLQVKDARAALNASSSWSRTAEVPWTAWREVND